MNLRIDLILDSEQRSGSLLSLKSAMRVGSIAVPAIVVVLASVGIMRAHALSQDVRVLEESWREILPRKEAATKTQAQVAANLGRLKEIESWMDSRIDLAGLMANLEQEVPATAQLTELRFTDEFRVVEKQGTKRVFTLNLSGKADGQQAKDNVETLTVRLQTASAFTSLVAKAVVPDGAFRQDPAPDAPPTRRVFQIECAFRERDFEDPVAPHEPPAAPAGGKTESKK